jgi:predicted amidophosphoribosyltransferase
VNSKTILLVDDIKTTGATLDACATILKIRGAEKVYCVTAALAGVKKKEEKTE